MCNLLLNDIYALNKILNINNVDKEVDFLNEIFIKNLNGCAPIVTKEIRCPAAPWIMPQVKNLMQSRDVLQRMLKMDIALYNQYKAEKKKTYYFYYYK